VPLSGFGYPLSGFRPPNLGSIFQLPTLLGLTLQSFQLLPDDPIIVSNDRSASALSCITSAALHRRFSGFLPSGKPYPFLLPGGLVQVGVACSHGLFGFPGFLFSSSAQRGSLFKLPSSPYPPRNSHPIASWASGSCVQRGLAFPPKGRLPA